MRISDKKKFISSFLILLMASAGLNFYPGVQAKFMPEMDSQAIIIKFKPGTPEDQIQEAFNRHKALMDKSFSRIGARRIKVSPAEREKIMQEYRNDPKVEYAEPDYVAKAFKVTNDPSLPNQWGMYKIQAANQTSASAWDVTGCTSTIKIAVLDTGIDETHPELAGKVVARNNFSTSSTNNDVDGHGTHVAGIIAANSNNSAGVAGVAYGASLMNVKVLGDDGSGSYSSIVNGIIWATDNGAKVINMSLGSPNASTTLQDAVNYAWSKGVVVVAAAGNDGNSSANYPAYYSNSIAVASTDSADSRSSFSQYGSWVDVAAPGSGIYSTYAGNAYKSLSGTSMASPHVAGLAGLVWAKGDCSTNSCVRSKIESTADKIVGTGSSWAYGRINAYEAVGGNVSNPQPQPVPTPDTPPVVPSPQPAPAPVLNPPAANPPQNPSNEEPAAGPVTISGIAFLNKNKRGGRLVWNTNINSTATVKFGTSRKKLKRTVSDRINGTHHEINFTTLRRGKTYYFQITVQGTDDSRAQSAIIKKKLPKK